MMPDHLASPAVGSDRSSANRVSRRSFLQAGAAAGGGLILSLNLPFANGDADAAGEAGFAPNAFIRIQGDGDIVLTMPYVEMGQGTYTSIPMLIAEELEVDLKHVHLEHAPPDEKLYGNPLLGGIQATGNSTRFAPPGSRCAKPAQPHEPCSLYEAPGENFSFGRGEAQRAPREQKSHASIL